MGGRYFITGVQLGILEALAMNTNSKSAQDLLDEIQDKQYICDAEEFKEKMKK